jgi:hypothetical protein
VRFNSIADSAERALLTGVLDDVCMSVGIEPESAESEAAADLILSLYWSGNRTASDLKAAFDARVIVDAAPNGRSPPSQRRPATASKPTGDRPRESAD